MKRSEFFGGCLTVNKLIEKLKEAASDLPEGLDSPVTLGDFEGNYMQGPSLEVQIDKKIDVVFLGYEMHENIQDDLPYNSEDDVDFDPE